MRVLESEVDSVRSFVRLWIVLTAAVLAYAWLDLRLHPQLLHETQFSLEPDLSQLSDLKHWGGRLLNHGAVTLLLGNALVLSGLSALVLRALWVLFRRLRSRDTDSRISIVPGSVPTSVPPPRLPLR
jgi:hypothetical protein